MEPITDESLRRGHKVAVYICCAMIASVFVYVGVAEFSAVQNAPFHGYSPLPGPVHDKLRLILLVMALVDFSLIPYLRNRVLSADNRTGAGSVSSYPAAVQRLLSASVISFALCESIAIYGLVLFLLNGELREFYLFIFIALVSFVLHFPRYERWQERARNMPSWS
jgi:hypothetical protein